MELDSRNRVVANLLTWPEAPKQGRGRLIFTAVALFYRHGIMAIGLDRVIAEAGVSKTTFYKHFESKTDLTVAALQTRDEWEMRGWKEAVRTLAGSDPRDQLYGMLDVLDVLFNDPEFSGCQFINAAAEFPNPHDPIHKAAAAHKRANREWVRELAEEAGVEDPEVFSDAYTMLFEGALVMRHVHDRDDAARVARPLFDRLIEEHIPRG
jgi:AcrR family transcriptional regulator